jgi:hypothetical protein
VQGGLQAAEQLMDELEALGEPSRRGDYDGRMVQLGEEGTVGCVIAPNPENPP